MLPNHRVSHIRFSEMSFELCWSCETSLIKGTSFRLIRIIVRNKAKHASYSDHIRPAPPGTDTPKHFSYFIKDTTAGLLCNTVFTQNTQCVYGVKIYKMIIAEKKHLLFLGYAARVLRWEIWWSVDAFSPAWCIFPSNLCEIRMNSET